MAAEKAGQGFESSLNFEAGPSSAPKVQFSQVLRSHFIRPLLSQQAKLWLIFFALLLLSLSQSAFLLLAGPLLKAFFELSDTVQVVALSELVPPQMHGFLGDLAGREIPESQLVWWLPGLLMLAGVTKGLAGYIYHYQQSALALYIAKNYRDQLFQALVQQPYERLSRSSAGRFMSLIMNDVMVLQAKFSDFLAGLVKDGMLVISCILVLLFVHWPTALVVLVLAPLLAMSLGRSGRRISTFAETWQRRLADMTSIVLSLRQRFDFIRSQGGEPRERASFEQQSRAYYATVRKSWPIRASMAPGMEFAGFLFFAILIYAMHQGWFDMAEISGVVLIQFFAAIALMLRPLRNIGEQIARFQETKGSLRLSLEALAELRDGAHAHDRRIDQLAGQNLPADLRLARLTVAYEDLLALQLGDLSIKKAQAIAIIGPSGAGKSTLVKSLAGLLRPAEWQANLAWEHCVARSAYVSQKTFLFDATIRENLSYALANQPASEAMDEVLAQLNLLDEIKSMPAGLDSQIQSVQQNLSGGQLQRLMVARALLREADLLLLDEATSAIDARTEESLIRYLVSRCHRNGQTLLFVTHRLQWLQYFDEVWLIENAQLALRGTHSELLTKPRYQKFLQDS